MSLVYGPVLLILQEDPTLLPQPNHVILNHLYALSIKVHSLLLLIELANDDVLIVLG